VRWLTAALHRRDYERTSPESQESVGS
jgi:hypothetical protein